MKEIGPFIREEMLFVILLYTYREKSATPPGSHVCFTNRIKSVNLLRGSPNNYFSKIISKSDQWFILNLFSKFFQSVAMATRVLLLASLGNNHLRNIPVKFSWNRPCTQGWDVVCNLLYVIGKEKPRPLAAMFCLRIGSKVSI